MVLIFVIFHSCVIHQSYDIYTPQYKISPIIILPILYGAKYLFAIFSCTNLYIKVLYCPWNTNKVFLLHPLLLYQSGFGKPPSFSSNPNVHPQPTHLLATTSPKLSSFSATILYQPIPFSSIPHCCQLPCCLLLQHHLLLEHSMYLLLMLSMSFASHLC